MENDALIGSIIAGCTIRSLIGQGGMARVYRAYQSHLDREVAIKVLPPQSGGDLHFSERFQTESRAMAKLRHPHIATIYDAGEQDGLLYIVMEYIGGGNLRQYMSQAIRISEAAQIFQDIASALAYAHERGIIHRDVKPANVLLDHASTPSQRPRAVLTDFGIATILSEQVSSLDTNGTPEYMSPEQCQNLDVDPRSDIYSLGVMLYEMLCGRPPFIGNDYETIARGHISGDVVPPATLNLHITGPVQNVILTALQKRPEQRFQSATEMAKALSDALATPGTRSSSRPLKVPCPRCQQPNSPAMNFCSRCGTHLRGGPPAALPPTLDLPPATCLNCGAGNPGINRHCTRCGAKLASVICVNCGRSNASGQKFCIACGEALPISR